MKKFLLPLVFIFLFSFFNSQISAQSITSGPKPIIDQFTTLSDGTILYIGLPVVATDTYETTIGCGQTSVNLTAQFNDVGTTDTYIVEERIPSVSVRFDIPVAGDPGEVIPSTTDDIWSAVHSLATGGVDMDFCFFQQEFNAFVVNSNGAVSFDTSLAGQFADWNLRDGTGLPLKLGATGNNQLFPNAIFTPFHDIDPRDEVIGGSGGDSVGDGNGFVYWNILGTAPNRVFVLGIFDMTMYDAGNSTVFGCNESFNATHQMLFYETTNIIEVNILEKPSCEFSGNWNGSLAVVGIQNQAMDKSFAAHNATKDRDTGIWSVDAASPESWRFIPNGGIITPAFTWYKNYNHATNTGDEIDITDVDEIAIPLDLNNPNQVFNPSVNTTYTAEIRYTNPCDPSDITISAVDVNIIVANDLQGEIVEDATLTSIEDVFFCNSFGDTLTVKAETTSPVGTIVDFEWKEMSSLNIVSTTNTYIIDSSIIGDNSNEVYEVTMFLYPVGSVPPFDPTNATCIISDTVNVIVGTPSFDGLLATYCAGDTDPIIRHIIPSNGVLTITNDGVLGVDIVTGEPTIDLSASGLGADGLGFFDVVLTGGAPTNCPSPIFTIQIFSPTITGALSVCQGSTQLTGSGTADATTPWTTSDATIATVNNTGLVTGVASGTVIITYLDNNGCSTAVTVTVNSATITGTLSACLGFTTQLAGSGTADATTPWTTSDATIATVSNTGLVTSVAAGTADITYLEDNGCTTTETVTINGTPTITGTLSSCLGFTTQLAGSGTADATTPWTTSDATIATVDNAGLVTSVAAGTADIIYLDDNGCTTTETVTINGTPTITGTVSVCIGSTTLLVGSGTADATTPWTSSNVGIATVSNTGLVTGVAAGTVIITYLDANGCTNTETVTINAATITGTLSACLGFTTQLIGSGTADATTPWATSNATIATVSNTGLVTSVAAGTAVITYLDTNGCSDTETVTINGTPTITGTVSACIGSTTLLVGSGTADATTPWISSNVGIATVNNTGLVTGVAAGTAIITYLDSNGCSTTETVTINEAIITGILSACLGYTTQLTGSGTANTTSTPWTSSNTVVATVDNTGLVTSVAAGTTNITYLDNNGCSTTEIITINEATITGTLSACLGSTTQLTGSSTADATTPWTSSNAAVATVDNIGLVTGITVGISIITYLDSNGCSTTETVTINGTPTITGILAICLGSTTQLTGSSTANATTPWTTSSAAVATVDNTGLVTSVAVGTTDITYLDVNGCSITETVTIQSSDDTNFYYEDTNGDQPIPDSITGIATIHLCEEQNGIEINPLPYNTTTFASGGTFSILPPTNSSGVALIVESTGVINFDPVLPNAIEVGTYIITYSTIGITPPNTCPTTTNFELIVDPSVDASITMSVTEVCEDDTTNPQVTIDNNISINQGGVFSITTTTGNGTAEIDAATGEVNLANSDAGIYDITYTINATAVNVCTDAQTIPLEIIGLPEFTLPDTAYICPDGVDENGLPISNAGIEIIAISNVPGSNYTYEWFDSNNVQVDVSFISTTIDTNDTLILNDPIADIGLYYVIATSGEGCISQPQIIQVVLTELPVITNVFVNDFSNDENSITVEVEGGTGDYTYTISYKEDVIGINDGQLISISQVNDPIFENIFSEEYTIQVIDNLGCTGVTVELGHTIVLLDAQLHMTPNGDGRYDTWNIREARALNPDETTIYVFDKFGKVLAKVDPRPGFGWDGTYNGKQMPASDYWYTAEYIDPNTGQPKKVNGHFSIVRKGQI